MPFERCKFPLFKHRGLFVIVDSEDGGNLFRSLSPCSRSPIHTSDFSFRWSQMVKGTSLLWFLGEILPWRGAWNHNGCALAQRFNNGFWHLECILVLLVQDDSPEKQFMFFPSWHTCLQSPTEAVLVSFLTLKHLKFFIPPCLLWAAPHWSSGGL